MNSAARMMQALRSGAWVDAAGWLFMGILITLFVQSIVAGPARSSDLPTQVTPSSAQAAPSVTEQGLVQPLRSEVPEETERTAAVQKYLEAAELTLDELRRLSERFQALEGVGSNPSLLRNGSWQAGVETLAGRFAALARRLEGTSPPPGEAITLHAAIIRAATAGERMAAEFWEAVRSGRINTPRLIAATDASATYLKEVASVPESLVALRKKYPPSPLQMPSNVPQPIITDRGTLRKPSPLAAPSAAEKPGEKETAARDRVLSYTVAVGDTLSSIAERFGLTTQTVIWANAIDTPNALKLGNVLRIPPVSGVLHKVSPGDTLLSIAERYQVDVTDITGFSGNKLGNLDALVLGQEIVVPRGVKPIEPPPSRSAATQSSLRASESKCSPVAGGMFQWPTSGPVYRFFSRERSHPGVSLAPAQGTPVCAMASGTVIVTDSNDRQFGRYILLEHGEYRTLYARLSAIEVTTGQIVVRGDMLGRVGNSGRDDGLTDPHLYFEVHRGGSAVNPLEVLPR